MSFTFNNTDDTIDLRDVIERFEELESEREDLENTFNEAEENYNAAKRALNEGDGSFSVYLEAKEALEAWDRDNGEELKSFSALLEDLKGYGGDEQWRGDWYPLILIRESYFTDYTEDLVSDCYDLKLPDFVHVDWEATAREVKVDYSETNIDGVTYFYR